MGGSYSNVFCLRIPVLKAGVLYVCRVANCKKHTSRPTGFTLLIVLLILAIMISVTTTVSYSVASQSLAVSSTVSSFQNRLAIDAAINLILTEWSSGSAQTALLEEGRTKGLLKFSDHVVEYQLADESTKIRVVSNQSIDLSTVLGESFGIVSLKQTSITDEDGTPQVKLFEDVFHVGVWELGQFYGELNDKPSVSDAVTLWGDGRLNLFTASEDTIRLAFSDMSQIMVESIIAARRFSRTTDLERLIDLMGLSMHDRRMVSMRLTDTPRCLSIRIACHGPVLRTDAFVVCDVSSEIPTIILWRDLPSGKNDPEGVVSAYQNNLNL